MTITCKECQTVMALGKEMWVDSRLGGWDYFCSRACADFYYATLEADDLAYVMRSLGMEVSDA